MPSLETESDYIDELLRGAIGHVDIPPELRKAAEAEYLAAGNWLANHADGDNGWRVYPQGSFLLNTVVLPRGRDHYDLDSVCVREIEKEATTQTELKEEVGTVLAEYVRNRDDLRHITGNPSEGKRCWTVAYPEHLKFHMDVLPAIPNPDSETGILITDRALRHWQYSNPQAFAEWFRSRCATEFRQQMLKLAEAQRVEPEEIPDWRIKTVLHRTVQVLKLHRNEFFKNDLDRRPASVLITTLAARAYTGEPSLLEALIQTGDALPSLVERPEGIWTVRNPVEAGENFADKWNSKPELPKAFFKWADALSSDLRAAKAERGLDGVASRLSDSLGGEPIEEAMNSLGDAMRERRDHGSLGIAPATGALTAAAAAVPVKKHTFYGDPDGA